MRPKLIAIFLLIVFLPLGLLVWLGVRVVKDERENVERRFQGLLKSKLGDIRNNIAKLVERRRRSLMKNPKLSPDNLKALRRQVWRNPIIGGIFVLDRKGKRLYPPPLGPLNDSDREFLVRAGQIWRDRHHFYRPSETQPARPEKGGLAAINVPLQQRNVPLQQRKDQSFRTLSHEGWYVWYWGSGLHLLFWRQAARGRVLGIELDRIRLMADIVAELPDSNPLKPRLPQGRILLANAKGDTIYQWGAYEPPRGEGPKVSMPLERPLNSWQLRYYASLAGGKMSGSLLFSLLGGLLAVGLVLVGLAFYFYRENSREIREAAQRVSFVNKVSHELKTPLTNIRMYAELLEQSFPEESGEKGRRQLGIIVSESQRLSRLIGNVLTFARQRNRKINLRLKTGVVDEVIASVLDSFKPSLESKGVAMSFSGGAKAPRLFDADALEQILGNLFSNVEKYAASGGLLKVISLLRGDQTVITVSDHGPGLPPEQREKIFLPFYRLSDRLADGVTGTGIGLAIARELARLHGGDLTLLPSEKGAAFQVVLRTSCPDSAKGA